MKITLKLLNKNEYFIDIKGREKMQVIKVDKNGDGKKLITYLTNVYPDLKLNTVYKALRKKDIKINGKRINEDVTINFGDTINIYIIDELLYGKNENKTVYSIVYQDDNILVINKDAGIEIVGKDSITELLKKEYDFIEPCHRIDRNTKGIVLFAKNEYTLNCILNLFKENKIEKHYIACCYGVSKKQDDLNAYLFKDRKKSIVYISDSPQKGYVAIKTSYKTIKQNINKKISLLDVTLHTGKTHQIRAHLASVGLPIIGDGKYGSYKINHEYKQNKQMLCSYSLTFRNIIDERLQYLNDKTINLATIPFKELFN